ncbi:MAG: PIN domain-containing protein [Chloroflexota bacterium]
MVLDASALLVILHREPGIEVVWALIESGAFMRAVNYAETLTRLAKVGVDPANAHRQMVEAGLIGQLIEVVPFEEDDAIAAAALRPPTRRNGLSLGDRACLALGRRPGRPVRTSDRAWAGIDAGVEILFIRE